MKKFALQKCILCCLLPLFLLASCEDEDSAFVPISAKFSSDNTVILLYDGYWGEQTFKIEAYDPLTKTKREINIKRSFQPDPLKGKLYIKYSGTIEEYEVATLYVYEHSSCEAKFTIKRM